MTDMIRELSAEELLPIAVALEYRRRHAKRGITILTHPWPKCPDCDDRPEKLIIRDAELLVQRLLFHPCGHQFAFHGDTAYQVVHRAMDIVDREENRPVGEPRPADFKEPAGSLNSAPANASDPEDAADQRERSGSENPRDQLRDRYARLLCDSAGRLQFRFLAVPGALLDAVLAVRDTELAEARAKVAELEREMAARAKAREVDDRWTDRVDRENDQLRAQVARVRALAADMRTWCSPHGIATDYADRIVEALDGRGVEVSRRVSGKCVVLPATEVAAYIDALDAGRNPEAGQ
jgi:hypothetical protein